MAMVLSRTILVSALLLASLLLQCCSGEKRPTSVRYVEPRYIRNDGYRTVIVFVHGIFGDGQSTWTNVSTKAYWPELLEGDEIFRKADIYVYSYPTPFLQKAYNINDVIGDMRNWLEKDFVFRAHDEVVFLCHSMGGLVVRGYLRRYQNDARKVSLIYFFSTPTNGTQVAEMARVLSKNPQLGGMLPVESSEYVNSMQDDWRELPVHPVSKCAYENKDTYGIRIVDKTSASSLCDEVTPLWADHIGIVKPRDQRDIIYSVFQRAFDDRLPTTSVDFVATADIKKGQPVKLVCSGPVGMQRNCLPTVQATIVPQESSLPVSVARNKAPAAQRDQTQPTLPSVGTQSPPAPSAEQPIVTAQLIHPVTNKARDVRVPTAMSQATTITRP